MKNLPVSQGKTSAESLLASFKTQLKVKDLATDEGGLEGGCVNEVGGGQKVMSSVWAMYCMMSVW